MGTLLQDVGYGLRIYTRSISFTIVTVLTLAFGIGASTAVFSLVDALLLNPLPYPGSDRIVLPWRLAPKSLNLGYSEIPWGRTDFQFFAKESKAFESMAAFQSDSFNFVGSDDPIRLDGLRASAGFFSALGVGPILGRTFLPEEDQPGHEREVVLSYALWRSQFGGSSGVLGHEIILNGYPYTIVGVMPANFTFPKAAEMPAGSFPFARLPQVWVPLALPSGPLVRGEPSELAVVARLKVGASMQEAQADMDHMRGLLEHEYPKAKGWFNSRVTPLAQQVAGNTKRPLLLILVAVGVVLLVVCFNVASLLLARSPARTREFTLRAALGAERGRLIRQVLTESLVLAVVGGLLGMLVAEAGVYLVKFFGPPDLPRLAEAGLDWRVAAFAVAITLVTGLSFGLVPAMAAARRSLVQSLKEGGQRSIGGSSPIIRKVLLISEIALALLLVVASGLLTQTLWHLLRVNPGFNPERVLSFELSLPASKYVDNDHVVAVYQEILRRVRSVPGINSAGITEALPMGGATESTVVIIPGRPVTDQRERPFANYTIASSGYFNSIGTPILQGRDFLDSDGPNTLPVAIINDAMAKKYWPGQNPIGQQLSTPTVKDPAIIVGIVADIKHTSLREETGPEMYIPFTQKVWPSMLVMDVVVRSQVDPNTLMGSVRAAVYSVDRALPLAKIKTLATLVDESVAGQRFSVIALGFFGGLSVLLASIGMYGVISYSVAQRTQEIGIRMALGAQRRTVFGMILGQGARLAVVGIVIGLVLALILTRMIASFLFGVQALDPLTLTIAALMVIAVVLLACYLPARRATRVDPLIALRYE
jgi:putative ABC transport system permease protein